MRGGSEPPHAAKVAGAEGNAVVVITVTGQHYTALLPELHGRNSSLHRHPFFHSTHGEPPIFPLLAAGPCYSGHVAPYRERVGQGRPRPLGTPAQHTHVDRDHPRALGCCRPLQVPRTP